MPAGGVQAGAGSTSAVQHPGLLGSGIALLLAASVIAGVRWRTARSS